MKNRHGVEYRFIPVSKNTYRFDMTESAMQYMRMGGREGQDKIDRNDLGMFDPSGGPYVEVGSKIYWDEIHDAVKQDPLIVERIMSTEEGIFVEAK
tara:strand:+ start:2624 stop:2911 length:288 start_codon:yes stop_codon:yes gene_type:complete